MIPDKKGDWGYTSYAVDYAKRSGHYAQERDADGRLIELYQGRHIIARDTKINKGVYFINGDEAVVVDDENDQSLVQTYEAVLAQIEQIKLEGKEPKNHILKIVWETVLRVMPYDYGEVRVNDVQQRLGKGRKTYLGAFMGGGVCRHQGLLVAYLLEKLVSQGYLSGKVSVDRNMNDDRTSGHAWARYTSSRGKIFILDVAQKYIGELDTHNSTLWPYARPEDLAKQEPVVESPVKNWRQLEQKKPTFTSQLQRLLRQVFLPKTLVRKM